VPIRSLVAADVELVSAGPGPHGRSTMMAVIGPLDRRDTTDGGSGADSFEQRSEAGGAGNGRDGRLAGGIEAAEDDVGGGSVARGAAESELVTAGGGNGEGLRRLVLGSRQAGHRSGRGVHPPDGAVQRVEGE
jgi:hypothetical protein